MPEWKGLVCSSSVTPWQQKSSKKHKNLYLCAESPTYHLTMNLSIMGCAFLSQLPSAMYWTAQTCQQTIDRIPAVNTTIPPVFMRVLQNREYREEITEFDINRSTLRVCRFGPQKKRKIHKVLKGKDRFRRLSGIFVLSVCITRNTAMRS